MVFENGSIVLEGFEICDFFVGGVQCGILDTGYCILGLVAFRALVYQCGMFYQLSGSVLVPS